jgi:hypothetical protein
MAKTLKIVCGFAAVGFFLPLILLTYYTVAQHNGKNPNTDPLFYLCPSSIMSMGLTHGWGSTAVVVWLLISASNAVLYAIPGVVVALIRRVRSSN